MTGQPTPSFDRTASGSAVVRCVAGPDAGWSVRLDRGSHWLGRGDVGVGVADPSVEPHHALVDVAANGSIAILQTTGRTAVRVDGSPTAGWTAVPAGSTLEVGASRFIVGTSTTVVTSPMSWIYAPHDSSATELVRFERDVGLAAGAARHHLSVRPAGDSVDLGVAEVDVAVDVRNSSGQTVAIGDLDLTAQAIVERCCRATVPLWITLTANTRIAIVAPDRAAVAEGIRRQLPAARRARVLVVEDDADALAGSCRPMIVLVRDPVVVPTWCRSLLEVGETWRGVWWDDVHDRTDRAIRLHVRGPSRSERSPSPTGRGVWSADAGRAVVAQQVSRTGAELGGSVVGVPEAARRQ